MIAIDGVSFSRYVNPTLTTLRQPMEEMGAECVRILVDAIEGRGKVRHVRLKTSCRQGGSVKRLCP